MIIGIDIRKIMYALTIFLKTLLARFRRISIFGSYSAVAMAEGNSDMARGFLDKVEHSESEIEELRLEFKARYHNFKLLLQANNSALENMAGIEQVLQERKPFSMSFIREKVTAISVDVYRMIRNLEEIAPGKYSRLENAYNTIRDSISRQLEPRRESTDGRWIIPFRDIDERSIPLVGNKMGKIGEIRNVTGLDVPDGFVITTAAYGKIIETNNLQAEIDKQFQVCDFTDMKSIHIVSTKIQQLIRAADIPEELENEIRMSFGKLIENSDIKRVALRSSALGEDLARTSFAGQYRSELNVSAETLIESYKKVIASKYGFQAITYRFNRGIKDEDVSMSVGCMLMLNSVCGGVMYSRNPVRFEDRSVRIESCWGLPKTVVEGNAPCDEFIVSGKAPFPVINRDIKNKKIKYICKPEGGIAEQVIEKEERSKPSLEAELASELAGIALTLEEFYKGPQDIEWAITETGTIHILQCRPLMYREERTENRAETEVVYDRSGLLAEGGITVCPGVTYGPVHWIDTKTDIPDFPQGAILATSQALPRWAPLLNEAAGIITEEGSFAGHLANVARELCLPALFGLSGLKTQLENGKQVTLDSGRREIHAGRVEPLLQSISERKNLMADSPVYQTLSTLSRHIVPLNLLDPDSADFRPSKCTTLHDITRFIHEKSVSEMFDFGKAHHFSERSGKQLFYKVPMQWWVLNLDDGFVNETNDRYVTLDNIASIPMLALWDGIVAIPWEGPPPIDGRGLMSVMFQASTNMALTSRNGSRFSDRNYFMISRNFCSLSSRLGFHFTTVESMVSEEREENYISFQYKGGAADYQRRLNRVLFLGEILEQYGFTADIRKDNLIARVENREKPFILERLKILGYLTIHTRQIDMIMRNNSTINYYKSKFTRDIATLLNEEAAIENV